MTQVKLQTTLGDLVLELDTGKAPVTTENFLGYVRRGFYDGTLFHRVIPGFMIQGGGFEADMQSKPTAAPIRNEADNGLKNKAGSIAMARTADPHSASSQFFINLADNDFLDHSAPTPQGWGYCVFGQLREGEETLRKIGEARTGSARGHQDVPVEDMVILKAEIL